MRDCTYLTLRVQNSGKGGNWENASVFKFTLELVGETGDSRVVGVISPLAPLFNALIFRSVPIAVQLPVNMLEPLVDEVYAIKKPMTHTSRICITSS